MKNIPLLVTALLISASFSFAQADDAPRKKKSSAPKAAVSGEAPAPEAPVLLPTPPTPSRFSVGTHLSYWNAKDLDRFDVDGFLGGGVVGQFRLIDPLALELRIGGYAAGYSKDVFIPGAGWFENTVTIVSMPLEAGVLASLPLGDRFRLYGGAGAGLYLFDGEFKSKQGRWEQTCDMELDTEAGAYGLLGLQYRLAWNAALYLEAKYTAVETSLKDGAPALDPPGRAGDFPLDKDIDLSGLSVQAGFLFTF